ncbi:MAG: hypothetical protein RLZZ142_1222 [Verrucomicrobiota bacterium]|jgi:periplasmic divalent cation tolerance protein
MSAEGKAHGVVLGVGMLPDAETARKVAHTLVEEGLAACVNWGEGVESVYRWKGRVETSREVWCWIKTTRARCGEVMARYRALHPYDVAVLEFCEIQDGLPEGLRWVEESVRR